MSAFYSWLPMLWAQAPGAAVLPRLIVPQTIRPVAMACPLERSHHDHPRLVRGCFDLAEGD